MVVTRVFISFSDSLTKTDRIGPTGGICRSKIKCSKVENFSARYAILFVEECFCRTLLDMINAQENDSRSYVEDVACDVTPESVR